MVINVCIGSACHLKGSYDIIKIFEKLIEENKLSEKLSVKASFCLGNCVGAVSVKFDDKVYSVQPDTANEFFESVVREKVC
ncbi:hypothetical protein B5E58_02635 [Tyzzerella sp. An114]|uniref:NAD(P)H-dependent oxidoreductase subunit E n=1 Tax=Tyzzerella sp. An114 TaxID=1965545 RepID=UPI000B4348C0|nr:NAD(P)H-dependent oxidoreductase subunit E [Tyzzerella sp. An114]OUQ60005.1 hypothetical protein B5E58_02635 [Tyzzerella sp. An114]